MQRSPELLYVATSDAHLKLFHRPHLQWLEENGMVVDICAEKRWNCELPSYRRFINLPFPRKAFGWRHFRTLFALIALLRKSHYDVIHCHTPVAAMLIRTAQVLVGSRKTRVVYTVHGYHFYPGSPRYFWLLYYPVEWMLSWFTDDLITINRTEYLFAQSQMHYKKVHYMPGMGLDPVKLEQAETISKSDARKQYRYSEDDFILLYSAEFIPRKNHLFLLRAVADLVDKIPTIRLILAGQGRMQHRLKAEAERLKIADRVDFIGYVDRIGAYLRASDVAVSAALNEGFGMGVAEASAMGLPVVVTNTNGHRDIVTQNESGLLFELNDQAEFQKAILKLYSQPELAREMAIFGRGVTEKFSLEAALSALGEVYRLESLPEKSTRPKKDGILVF